MFSKNVTSQVKIPLILPSILINKLEPDLKLKAYFTPVKVNSVTPNFIECKSMGRLSPILFNDRIILKNVRPLNINKAYCHDEMSIRMINRSII